MNPRIGVIWQALAQAQVFANLSWSTEPPTLSDLIPLVPVGGGSRPSTPSAPRPSRSARAARRAHSTGRSPSSAARLRDEIQQFTFANGHSFALNADRTLHTGVEAGLLWRIAKDTFAAGDLFQLRQAYTYSWYRFDNDPVFGNNQLPGMPRNLYNAELRYRHPSGAWIAPTINWSPTSYFVDNANTQKTDSYILVGLRGGVQLEDGLSAFVEARNLANTRYIASANVVPVATPASAIYEPGIGRAVYGGLQVRF